MIAGRTFAEKWKVAALTMVAGAGIVATIILATIIGIIWKGHWSEAVELLRVNTLAQIALGMVGLMGASMVGLLIAGPLAKLSAKFGNNEVSAEGDAS